MSAATILLLLSSSHLCGPALPAGSAAGSGPGGPELEALYRSGAGFGDFLAAAEGRRALWERRYRDGKVADDLLERARAVPGRWRLLAVAEDWCSDSVNTIPFLALLAERVEGLELRIVDSDRGREVMEGHRTPDGRPATPTVLLLDESYEEVGCWIERPGQLQAWALEARPALRDRDFLERKMAWYEEDAGASTVAEIVSLLEAAASGSPRCDAA